MSSRCKECQSDHEDIEKCACGNYMCSSHSYYFYVADTVHPSIVCFDCHVRGIKHNASVLAVLHVFALVVSVSYFKEHPQFVAFLPVFVVQYLATLSISYLSDANAMAMFLGAMFIPRFIFDAFGLAGDPSWNVSWVGLFLIFYMAKFPSQYINQVLCHKQKLE